MDRSKRTPLSSRDKRCLVALAALWLVTGLLGEALDGGGAPASQPEDKPLAAVEERVLLEVDQMVFYGEAPDASLLPPAENGDSLIADLLWEALYDELIPLDRELQAVLWKACTKNNVPVPLALGLIQEESCFQVDAVSSKGAYGLCQLNPKYFPADLTPAENIAAGVAWLGGLLKRHGDTAAALRAYNLGWDDGDRVFADAVLAAAERWELIW